MGVAAGRAAARATGNINYVWARHSYGKRELAERGGVQTTADPPPRWIVDATWLQEVLGARPQNVNALGSVETRLEVPGIRSHGVVLAWLRAPA